MAYPIRDKHMNTRQIVPLLLCVFWFPNFVAAQDKVSDDEKAVTALITGYVDAMNRADAAAAASHWSSTGEWINPLGERVSGPAEIEKALAAMFTAGEGPKIELQDVEVRFLAPTVATEEGNAIVVRAGDAPVKSTYISILVKSDAGWKIESIRETKIPERDSHYQHLKELEWMVGSWEDKVEDSVVETNCNWTSNKNFLLRTYRAKVGDEIEHEGTQIVGWDPVKNQIRSWVFDSDGGFGQGLWKRTGKTWSVDATYQGWDGGQASSTNRFTYIDSSTFTYESVDRKIDGKALPDVSPLKITRVVNEEKE